MAWAPEEVRTSLLQGALVNRASYVQARVAILSLLRGCSAFTPQGTRVGVDNDRMQVDQNRFELRASASPVPSRSQELSWPKLPPGPGCGSPPPASAGVAAAGGFKGLAMPIVAAAEAGGDIDERPPVPPWAYCSHCGGSPICPPWHLLECFHFSKFAVNPSMNLKWKSIMPKMLAGS